jgi:hypothetical protein
MKKWIFALTLGVITLQAQTKLDTTALACKGTQYTGLTLVPVATLTATLAGIPVMIYTCVQLDTAGFTLDTTTTPPTLRAKAVTLPTDTKETPTGSVNGTNNTFTLAFTPNTAFPVDVFNNGLLLTVNQDYTISGNTVTFLAGTISAVPQTGDLLQVKYWH